MVGLGAWAVKRRQAPLVPAPPAADPAEALAVETTPPGATVSLDGVAQGQTPLPALKVLPGGQLLRVEKAGFRSQELTVKPGDGEIRLTLVPEERGGMSPTPPPGSAGGATETSRLQDELKRLQEANAREEARLRQAGKAGAARPGATPAAAAPPQSQPAGAAPAQAAAAPAAPAPPVPVPAVPVLPAHRDARVLQQASPAYPAQALGNPLYTLREQRVRVRVFVNENGLPLQVVVSDGVGRAGFDEAAMAAARRSTYLPAVQNGRTTGAWLELTFVFRAPR
jgi:2-oxoglutarate dehydrogenase E2 component (dihydrolipoamide succinyltransferase)